MHDTALSSVVQNAFQALALDEHRAAFTPTLWERPSALKNINRTHKFQSEREKDIVTKNTFK